MVSGKPGNDQWAAKEWAKVDKRIMLEGWKAVLGD